MIMCPANNAEKSGTSHNFSCIGLLYFMSCKFVSVVIFEGKERFHYNESKQLR